MNMKGYLKNRGNHFILIRVNIGEAPEKTGLNVNSFVLLFTSPGVSSY